MAEFVLLTPVMIFMWMGIEYFRSGYARRLQALGRSQTIAWKKAYSNDGSCFKGGSTNLGMLAGAGADLSGGGSDAYNAVDTYSNNAKNSSIFMYANSSSSQSETTHLAAWDKTRGSVRGSTVVLCNEVVPSARNNADQDVLTPLQSFITGAFPKL